MEPNKKNIRKWVKALRSGKYKRGKDSLRDGDKFCCLGVACDISGVGKWSDAESYDGEASTLPTSVSRWLGVYGDNPEFKYGNNETKFASELNDNHNWSFKKIANAIERTFLKGDK